MVKKVKCPQCKKEVSWENNQFRPFCSERCKMIDLGTWAKEEFRVSDDNELISIQDDTLDKEIV